MPTSIDTKANRNKADTNRLRSIKLIVAITIRQKMIMHCMPDKIARRMDVNGPPG